MTGPCGSVVRQLEQSCWQQLLWQHDPEVPGPTDGNDREPIEHSFIYTCLCANNLRDESVKDLEKETNRRVGNCTYRGTRNYDVVAHNLTVKCDTFEGIGCLHLQCKHWSRAGRNNYWFGLAFTFRIGLPCSYFKGHRTLVRLYRSPFCPVCMTFSCFNYFSTLKMETACFSETFVIHDVTSHKTACVMVLSSFFLLHFLRLLLKALSLLWILAANTIFLHFRRSLAIAA